jgi:ribonuclease D
MASHPQGAVDVTNRALAEQAAQSLRNAPELAVDVEADAMHAFRARLCFVQVATDDELYLLDTLSEGVDPRVLSGLFADPSRTKYFHAAGGDLAYLAEAGVRVQGLFDTHRAATLLGWQKVGLADLARERLGVELKKEHQQSDFSLRPLPAAMREYIADDVRYLCEIGRQVRAACVEADVLEEVLLDCQRLADEAAERPPEGAEFKPKLNRQLLGPENYAIGLAIAQALNRKRLAWAEGANVPFGRILSNAAISAIAQEPPRDLRELVKREGVRGAFVREHGDEVLALIAEVKARAARGELREAQEKAVVDPKRRKRDEALRAYRSEKAKARKVTPSVVLTNPLIEALAGAPPTSLEALNTLKYFGEKRVRLYGAELLEVLSKI